MKRKHRKILIVVMLAIALLTGIFLPFAVFGEEIRVAPIVTWEKPYWCEQMSNFVMPEKSTLLSNIDPPTCILVKKGEKAPNKATEKGYPINWEIEEGLELLYTTGNPYIYEFFEKESIVFPIVIPNIPIFVKDNTSLTKSEKAAIEKNIRDANPEFNIEHPVAIKIDDYGNAVIFDTNCRHTNFSRTLLIADNPIPLPVERFDCPFEDDSFEDDKTEEVIGLDTSEDINEQVGLTVYFYNSETEEIIHTEYHLVPKNKEQKGEDFATNLQGFVYAYTDEESFTPYDEWSLNLYYVPEQVTTTDSSSVSVGYIDADNNSHYKPSPDLIALKTEVKGLKAMIPPFSVMEKLVEIETEIENIEKTENESKLPDLKRDFNTALLDFLNYKNKNLKLSPYEVGKKALRDEIEASEEFLINNDFEITKDGREGDYILFLYTLNEATAGLGKNLSDEEYLNLALSLSGYRLKLELSIESGNHIARERLKELLTRVESYEPTSQETLKILENLKVRINRDLSDLSLHKADLLETESFVLIQLRNVEKLKDAQRKERVLGVGYYGDNTAEEQENTDDEIANSDAILTVSSPTDYNEDEEILNLMDEIDEFIYVLEEEKQLAKEEIANAEKELDAQNVLDKLAFKDNENKLLFNLGIDNMKVKASETATAHTTNQDTIAEKDTSTHMPAARLESAIENTPASKKSFRSNDKPSLAPLFIFLFATAGLGAYYYLKRTFRLNTPEQWKSFMGFWLAQVLEDEDPESDDNFDDILNDDLKTKTP